MTPNSSSATAKLHSYRSVEAFIVDRSADWAELGGMLDAVKNKRVSALGGPWIARFADLYRSASADLAVAQLRFPRNPIVIELNTLAAQAHNALYAAPTRFWTRFATFFAAGFPRVIRSNARFVWAGTGVFVAAMFLGWLWFALDPNAALDSFGLTGGQFNEAEVPLTTPSESLVSFVEIGLNNIRVAFLAFAFGVLGCVGTLFLLVFNGLMLGVFGAQAFEIGQGADFMALVTPHGVVELTIIVLAGAAGMRIGWAVISPGRRRRGLAVAAAGRDAVRILVGTMPLFVLAALVEGFITTAGWSVFVNVVFGWGFGLIVWGYLAFAGRRQPS